jgi:hypothetical protein
MSKHFTISLRGGFGAVRTVRTAERHIRMLAPGLLALALTTPVEGQSCAGDCPHDTDGDGCEREYGDTDTSCGQHSDAMVCGLVSGRNDICAINDIRRGCWYTDPQDVDTGNDWCCFGNGTMNDSIDHAGCQSWDAGWGSGETGCTNIGYDVCNYDDTWI